MTTYFFSGVAKWTSQKLDTKYDIYTSDLYMDESSLAAYKKSGIRVKPKEDKDGETYYKFKRSKELTKKDGTVVTLGPPVFLNADGSVYEGLIGNGSKVTEKISTYDTAAGVGHRLEAIRIDELVLYVGASVAAVPSEGLPF